MRQINYKERWKELLTPEIVPLLTKIHEFKGEQTLFLEVHADELEHLVKLACIQSTDASNRMEGIYTSDERLKLIALDKTIPKTENEFVIAGYRDVLKTIHHNYMHIPVKTSMILQMHRDLYKFYAGDIGGKYQAGDKASQMMEHLCSELDDILKDEAVDPLLVIPMFILDFLCIHPFSDGNGQISRLLTLLLLYRSGYCVGRYISIERLIERSKDTYYEMFQESSRLWHEEKNNYEPFVKYMLSLIINVYQEFSKRVRYLALGNLSKPERVREIIRETSDTITKAEIMKKCPDISQITIQRALTELVEREDIIKIGGGRYTKYTWNWLKGDK